MEPRSAGLVETLRAARGRKGWSQRDLSQKAGLTQAHLSRIESGAVDLKLSTFLELARLLDLDPILAPRHALSAVNALIREVDADREARSARGAANSLQRLVRRLRLTHPNHAIIERLADLAHDLDPLEPLFRTPSELAELQDITDDLQAAGRRPDGEMAALKKGVDRLARLRDRLVPTQPETQRPAYSLDDRD